LRARLFALTTFVVGIAVLTVALLSHHAVRVELRKLDLTQREVPLENLTPLLAQRYAEAGSFAGTDTLLERLGRASGRDLLLVDSEGRVAGASSEALRSARISFEPGDRLRIVESSRGGPGSSSQQMILVGARHDDVRAPGGARLGTIYMLPSQPDVAAARGMPFVASVNRWILAAVAAAGLLALFLTAALSRRILGPVEALTAAVRKMERGDRGARVEVRSGDEVGELAHAFNAMADAVARNETLRRNLVSDVAHELRSPLTNLRAQIEILQDGLAHPDAATLRSLHDDVLLLGRLVDDLQDLALAEAGRLRLERGPVPVPAALEAALASVRVQAAEHGVHLRLGNAATPAVNADRERLAQILRNLLANAVTHTPTGGEVEVGARADGAIVTFYVRDTGEGIAPEHLPHLFDRFYRADPSRSRDTGGAGLGLAIVKQLVEAHGGRVWAESPPGAGSTFSFTLPAA
jgi:signal transduction histidine kinase